MAVSVTTVYSDGCVINSGNIPNTYLGLIALEFYVRKDPDPGYASYNAVDGPYLIIGGSQSFNHTVTGLESGTSYAANVKVTSLTSGANQWLGAVTFMTQGGQTNRPNTWTWKTPMVSGQQFYMPAAEWNEFCLVVNQFRAFKGRSPVSFTRAVTGQILYASQYNQAVDALMGTPSVVEPMPYLSRITVGTRIAPYQFTALANYTYYIW